MILLNKKQSSILLIITVGLVLSSSFVSLSWSVSDEINNTIPKKATIGRPVLIDDVLNATEILFYRNDAVYQGAVIVAEPGQNVTIWYTMDGGTNETLPRLYGDDGIIGSNLSWTEPILMPYDDVKVNISGFDRPYYNHTFQMNSDFIVFRAGFLDMEDDIGIPNIITTNVTLTSQFNQDYYTQFDVIDMNLTLSDYNITKYGLEYREVTPNHDMSFENVTFDLVTSGDIVNLTASFAHSYPLETQIEVRSFIYQIDNLTKEGRYLHENQAHIITLVDGRPELSVDVPTFTNNKTIQLVWEASAPKVNITQVNITWGDGSAIDTITNISLKIVFHTYASSGDYNITVIAFAGAGFTEVTLSILIDSEKPSGTILTVNPDGSNNTLIKDSNKYVTLTFNVSDIGGSEVKNVFLLTDEGNLYELIDEREITIQFFYYGDHWVKMTVYDNAGNSYSTTTYFTLVPPEDIDDIPIPFPFGITVFAGLALLAAVMYRKKR